MFTRVLEPTTLSDSLPTQRPKRYLLMHDYLHVFSSGLKNDNVIAVVDGLFANWVSVQ